MLVKSFFIAVASLFIMLPGYAQRSAEKTSSAQAYYGSSDARKNKNKISKCKVNMKGKSRLPKNVASNRRKRGLSS